MDGGDFFADLGEERVGLKDQIVAGGKRTRKNIRRVVFQIHCDLVRRFVYWRFQKLFYILEFRKQHKAYFQVSLILRIFLKVANRSRNEALNRFL